MKIYDITKELFTSEVYPGDPVPNKRRVSTVESDGYMLTELYMGTHSGTHVDAPCHFCANGITVSDIAIEKCMGKCAVCDNISLAQKYIEKDFSRIILKNIDITPEVVKAFADKIVLLGTDRMSFGGSEAKAVHVALLGKKVVLLESLVLDGVPCGEYELIALPLKLAGCDGSPVRAVLIDYEK